MERKSELRIAVLYDLLWMSVVVSLFMIPAITLFLYNPFIFAWIVVFPIVFTVSGTYFILRLVRYLTVKETYYIQCNSCHYADKIKKGAYRTGDACPRCGTGTVTKYKLTRDKKKGDVIDPFN